MTEFNWEILVPIIIALIAAIPGILSLLKGRKKESADTANVLVGTSLELLIEIKKKAAKAESDIKKLKDDLSQEIIRHEAESAQQQERIDSLQVQIDHLNDQILKYKKTQNLLIRGIKILIKQLEENKIKPNWNIDVDGLEIIE